MTFWLDAQRNLIVYPGQPGVLTQYIPDLKPLNGSYFAVPNTLANLQVLAWYNWPTPAPMLELRLPDRARQDAAAAPENICQLPGAAPALLSILAIPGP